MSDAHGDPLIVRLNAALAGRYGIQRELGAGGMATVYMAEDLKHDRRVAVKVLKPELAAVIGAERFLAEIRTTANLRHPHILPLFDSGQADGFLYYVMPLIEGESIRDRLDRERQLPVSDAVRIAVAVLHGLDHAHRRGIVHRDIKPENILLQDGEPVIADFGIALGIGQGGERLTETGLRLGTPLYMSPEQLTGDQSVGPATDIWAVGCVLYEMLAGKPPNDGGTPQAILGKIISREPEPVTTLRHATPPNVEAALVHALEKVPADRFGSADAFAAALTDPGFRYRERVVTPARVGRLGLAAIVGAAFVAGAVVMGVVIRSANPAFGGRGASTAQDPIVGFKIAGMYANPLARTVAIAPDGSRLASSTGSLSVRSIRQSDVAVPIGSDAAQPFFSPDGEWIGYFGGASANLMRVAATGGAPSLVSAGRARALGGSWGSDGTIVFATTVGLYRVPAAGGETELIAAPDPANGELYFAWPEILPGGRAVLFSIQPREDADDARGTIAALDLESLERRIVLRGGSGPRYSNTGHLLYTSGGALMGVAFDPISLRASGEPLLLSIEGIALARGSGPDYDISDNGTMIYVPAVGAQRAMRTLYWVSRDGNEESVPAPPRRYGYLRVAPDGSRIAMDLGGPNRDVYIWDLRRSIFSRLTDDPGEDFFAHWSPDGRRVFFSSNRSGIVNIYSRAADGAVDAEPVVESNAPQMLMAVGPRGDRLLTSQEQVGGGFDLVAWRLNEPGRVDTLIATEYNEFNAALSPDGKWMAYTSNQEGQFEVYVSAVSDAAGQRWKISVAGGDRAAWSPAGNEIYYHALAGGLMAATVQLAPTFDVDEVRELLPATLGFPPIGSYVGGRAYDVSPKDGRFLVSKPVSETEGDGIIVIVNWSRELRERIPIR